MRDINNSDVAILPRSSAIIMSDPRQELNNSNSYDYVEKHRRNDYLQFNEKKILPNGSDNNFPLNYKQLLDSVYIGHGVKRSLINLMMGAGIGLYSNLKEGNRIIRDWQIDNEIDDFLKSFDFEEKYIPEAVTDMIYVENNYTLFLRNRGARIGKEPKIASIKLLPAEKMRIEYPNSFGNFEKCFMSEWDFNQLSYNDIDTFNSFDKKKPFRYRTSVLFSKMPTFGSSGYGRPADIGAAMWLKVLALLPSFHKANLTERGFKFIVSVSRNYYEKKAEILGLDVDSHDFAKWKETFQQAIDDFLSAPEGSKIQTRFMTEHLFDRHTRQIIESVKITKLEDDTKQLSEVGMSLHDTATVAFVSASSIHPQLANIHLKNHALSGSNLVEAYNLHIKTATPVMRNIILNPINIALKANFPKKNLNVGFMDIELMSEKTKKEEGKYAIQ